MNSQLSLWDTQVEVRRPARNKGVVPAIFYTDIFEIFRETLNDIFASPNRRTGIGRPAWDVVLIGKILIRMLMTNISYAEAERQLVDSLSWRNALGFREGDDVPDEKTLWSYGNHLAKSNKARQLLAEFNEYLEKHGFTHSGEVIVDSSFFDVPIQRNTSVENKAIKDGMEPESFSGDDPQRKHKRAQKDVDARCGKKGQVLHFGYKLHAKVDRFTKMILAYVVTPASVHDSKPFVELVDESDRELFADCAYIGKDLHQEITRKCPNIVLHICERATKNKPLSDQQRQANREKAKVRCRVEHIFGQIKQSMNKTRIRCIGIMRATANIAMLCLAYNAQRFVCLSLK